MTSSLALEISAIPRDAVDFPRVGDDVENISRVPNDYEILRIPD